jgi:hypothetical protein
LDDFHCVTHFGTVETVPAAFGECMTLLEAEAEVKLPSRHNTFTLILLQGFHVDKQIHGL